MTTARLYPLLPAWYRAQDASSGLDPRGRAPIEAWLAQVESSFELLHAATGRSYDDWFVETCTPELLPALGGLVGLELEGPALPGDRRLVANALQLWRRRGSAQALQEAAEAACGWPVALREFEHELLAPRATSQREEPPSRRRAPALGANANAGPNLRRIALEVRRGFAVHVRDASPARLGANGWYTFDAAGATSPVSLRAPGVAVRIDGQAQPLELPDVELRQAWEADPQRAPSHERPLLDARRGRFWLPEPLRRRVRVDWQCWRPGPIGAGLPQASLEPPAQAWRALVSSDFLEQERGARCFRKLEEALAAWPAGHDADVRILDSRRYPALHVPQRPGCTLTLHAHPGELPCLHSIHSHVPLRLGGILVAGNVEVPEASAELAAVSVRGRVLLAGGSIRCSLVGTVEVTCAAELEVLDSVVGRAHRGAPHASDEGDGEGADRRCLGGPRREQHGLGGARLRTERSTFLGRVELDQLSYARDCLFCHALDVSRWQPGCLDHCPHPRGSRLPADAQRHAFAPHEGPRFASHHPASAGYACLLGPEPLLHCASDGGEPGAFHSLHVRARLARLEQMLARLLPAGFQASTSVLLEGVDG